jgi:hypothetical protein
MVYQAKKPRFHLNVVIEASWHRCTIPRTTWLSASHRSSSTRLHSSLVLCFPPLFHASPEQLVLCFTPLFHTSPEQLVLCFTPLFYASPEQPGSMLPTALPVVSTAAWPLHSQHCSRSYAPRCYSVSFKNSRTSATDKSIARCQNSALRRSTPRCFCANSSTVILPVSRNKAMYLSSKAAP